MIYLDNAATSLPKPPSVVNAMRDYMLHIGANPGRSGHRLSASASRIVFDTREALARLFNIADSRFLSFTQNATEAINIVLHGYLREGDHVVTTSMEHNSVMRPLNHLAQARGIRVSIAQADSAGRIDTQAAAELIEPKTRLVVVNHASNVTGTVIPVREVRQAIGSVPLLVDAAQTAGAYPIDVEADAIDMLAFTGHKSLLGPQGTGGLYVRPELADDVEPLIQGGTGSRSESESQPPVLPDRHESGTRNTAGIAGLGSALKHLESETIAAIRAHEVALTAQLIAGLREIDGVTIYGTHDATAQTPVISINIAGLAPSEVGLALDRKYDIAVRVGLHCSPAAHRTLGTLPDGTVRLAPGYATTADEIDTALGAIAEIAREARK